MLEKAKKEKRRVPPRVLLYGSEKVGKSSAAASAPDAFVIDTEGGLDRIEVARLDQCRSFADIVAQIDALITEDHKYKTVVIDSLDWMERLVWGEVCRQHGVKSIEKAAGGYGKGYMESCIMFRGVLEKLEALRAKGMIVILVCHSKVEKLEDPELGAYDRIAPRLHKLVMALVTEWSDAILYMARKTIISDGKIKPVGKGGGGRYFKTAGGPSCLAGNRYGLPEEIELPEHPEKMWSVFVEVLKTCMEEKNNG